MTLAESEIPDDSPDDLSMARARRLLRDMQDRPFCVLIFDGDSVSGYTKGLDSETSMLIKLLISEL